LITFNVDHKFVIMNFTQNFRKLGLSVVTIFSNSSAELIFGLDYKLS